MLKISVLFFALAFFAMLFGSTGLAGFSLDLGRTLVVAFLILATISFVAGMISRKSPGSTP